jgi:hypothetical protein
VSGAPAAPQPAFCSLAAGVPTFFQPATTTPLAMLPPVTPPPLGIGVASSVMPPGPDASPNGWCSVQQPGNGTCSAFAAGERCSAFNGGGDACSAFDFAFDNSDNICSAHTTNAICSVLPPSDPAGSASFCSASNGSQPLFPQCSAIGTAGNIRCSIKGQGSSTCSTKNFFGQGDYLCSVLNQGANQRSFCSTKFNAIPGGLAKACSTFGPTHEQCSVIAGGNGICTTFGAADPNSCSSFTGTTQCSVIGGAPGNHCVQ